jgi:NAD(P)-dependent dehydrogenase (short-subunit alcohol dehydrogenase family)
MSASPKRVVITGVTRGLGRAMAEALMEQGHQVIGIGRSRDQIEELRAAHRAPHDFDVVDVSEEVQVMRWAKRILKAFGPPDFLVNNAAIVNANAKLWEVSAEEFGRVIDVNIKGVAHVIRAMLPAMVKRGAGVVVNFSSYWGRSTAPEVAPYCATKWAIEGLTQAMSQELPAGMAAVAFNPGVIDTDMLRSCFGAAAAGYPSPERWAQAALPFLLKLGPKDNGKAVTAPS